MSTTIKGYVHSVETLGAVDGPGLRFVLFLQGCPLRCKFCHNPDTWRFEGGEEVTVKEQVKQILRYKNYIKSGGVTISGGEPLRQAEFVLELTRALHEEGIHVAIDTSGIYCEGAALEAAMEADLILLDIKSFDREKAKALTGFTTDHAWQLLEERQAANKPVWIRHVLVPKITIIDKKTDGSSFENEEEWKSQNAELVDGMRRLNTYSCIERVDLLPFHKMGEFKYEELHFPYELKETQEPDEQALAFAEKTLLEIRNPDQA
ncbi:MAG: pyruvate formate lyase-activating protein [Clostridiales bacterium]|nr:pyruvate formate lyase-activating protein [Clostridiales bacterium]